MNKERGNLHLIKRINRRLVLNLIRERQPISRASVAKSLHLSRSTVSSIVDDLLQKKLVVEMGYADSSKDGGRRGVELGFNPKSAYGIGVDIGGTKILTVITDLEGEIVYKEKRPTSQSVETIVSFVQAALHAAQLSEQDIVAMGVGVPSVTDIEQGIVVDAPALHWDNFKLQELLAPHFSFPVLINNDVNCAALGEQWLGSGNHSDNMFFIAIGTGVGSAIIANGQLIYGHRFQAGEIAYNIVEDDLNYNRTNALGSFGLLEQKISGTALNFADMSSTDLFARYKQGDVLAQERVQRFIRYLTLHITNAVNLLNPERVIIGGGVSESMKEIIDEINDRVNHYTPIRTKVELATLGGEAGALGAIAYAFNEVEESQLL
ncbi:ROK family transcriptional regulator [Sporolactobacillus terrae]|uniref:ROK family transcriptional regulator n=1 Tax=Sporolactobacillus terrae TaxID=269673 RepID=UPI00048EAE62|nr:ROK family transcriptional regulator [Sporolactobacillus terrae]